MRASCFPTLVRCLEGHRASATVAAPDFSITYIVSPRGSRASVDLVVFLADIYNIS
jgi:hypothetical protein